jgi:hypothetical protein
LAFPFRDLLYFLFESHRVDTNQGIGPFGDRDGALWGVANGQTRYAQDGRFFLDTTAIGDDKPGGSFQG